MFQAVSIILIKFLVYYTEYLLQLIILDHGLLTTVAYQLSSSSPPVYALEGSVAYSGSLIQWLRDNLQIIESTSDSEKIASQVSHKYNS